MQTALAFVELLLGFVPAIAMVAAILTALWAATKLFPSFGEFARDLGDSLFGVDEEYDEKHATGYTSTRHR